MLMFEMARLETGTHQHSRQLMNQFQQRACVIAEIQGQFSQNLKGADLTIQATEEHGSVPAQCINNRSKYINFLHVYMYIYMYIHVYLHVYTCIFTCIYIYRVINDEYTSLCHLCTWSSSSTGGTSPGSLISNAATVAAASLASCNETDQNAIVAFAVASALISSSSARGFNFLSGRLKSSE